MDRDKSFLVLNSKLKQKLIYVIEKGNFFYGKFDVHYIWYQRKHYNTGLEQGHINYLVYISIYEKK